MSTGKQYGLILPKKDANSAMVSKPNIFDEDSDDEKNTIEKSIRNEALKNLQKKQTRLEIERAILEDPTVYEYDDIYDDLQDKKKIQKALKTKDKTPKYITSLMKHAEQRKKDYERRTERKIHKERETEGEEFADKEAFVTSSYKKKMEEMQAEDEREKKQSEIEARLDVTKQNDLSSFYRHILNKSTEEDKPEEKPVVEVKQEIVASPPPPADSGNAEESELKRAAEALAKNRKAPTERNEDNDSEFSKDSESSSASSDEMAQPKKPKERSGRRRRRHEAKKAKKRKRNEEREALLQQISGDTVAVPMGLDVNERIAATAAVDTNETLPNGNKTEESVKVHSEEKIRKIFNKRNTGELFESATQRYFQRKAMRESNKLK